MPWRMKYASILSHSQLALALVELEESAWAFKRQFGPGLLFQDALALSVSSLLETVAFVDAEHAAAVIERILIDVGIVPKATPTRWA